MRRKRTNHEGLKVLMTKETNLDNKNSTQRVAIFIDGSNLYHSLEENCGRFDIDFQAFAQKLCSGRQLYRVYYYNVLREAGRNPHAFPFLTKFSNLDQWLVLCEFRSASMQWMVADPKDDRMPPLK